MPFGIAKADIPLVEVVPPSEPAKHGPKRIGFMKGRLQMPDDYDTLRADAIHTLSMQWRDGALDAHLLRRVGNEGLAP